MILFSNIFILSLYLRKHWKLSFCLHSGFCPTKSITRCCMGALKIQEKNFFYFRDAAGCDLSVW